MHCGWRNRSSERPTARSVIACGDTFDFHRWIGGGVDYASLLQTTVRFRRKLCNAINHELYTVDSMDQLAEVAGSRENLSDHIAAEIRDLIVEGRLQDGSRLNEVHLARQFQVSRSPLREALIRLGGMGFVVSLPRRGFFVRGLDRSEFEQLYSMRAILDPAALKLAGVPDANQLDRLVDINARLASIDGDPFRAIDVDDEWHRTLLAHCPNDILLEEIERFMQRTRRYEFAYLKESRNLSVAIDEHVRIIDALRANDLTAACAGLLQNMTSARQPLLDWLSGRGRDPTASP